MMEDLVIEVVRESVAMAPWAIGFVIALLLAWDQLKRLHEDNERLLSYLASLVEVLVRAEQRSNDE